MHNVFVSKSAVKPKKGLPIHSLVGVPSAKGLVGLEIEVEANNTGALPKSNSYIAPWWTYHNDGSLRGVDNAEYVLAKPIQFEQVPEAVDLLWQRFAQYNVDLADSNRTSVHVHLNAQTWHLNRVASFCALYYCFEEVLTQWCGEHRVGNLFCLRAKDAPAVIAEVKSFISRDGRHSLRDGLHYSGLNVSALQKFGSIEVRTLRGVKDPELIKLWVNILRRLYDLSAEYTDPRDVCSLFSAQGPSAFFENILGIYADVLRADLPFTEDQIRTSMYEGIRLAQDICYCRDWDLFEAMEVKPDPFGRSAKKVAQNLMAFENDVLAGVTPVDPPMYQATLGNGPGSAIAQYTAHMNNLLAQVNSASVAPSHWMADDSEGDF